MDIQYEFALFHHSGAENFEMAPRFGGICAPLHKATSKQSKFTSFQIIPNM